MEMKNNISLLFKGFRCSILHCGRLSLLLHQNRRTAESKLVNNISKELESSGNVDLRIFTLQKTAWISIKKQFFGVKMLNSPLLVFNFVQHFSYIYFYNWINQYPYTARPNIVAQNFVKRLLLLLLFYSFTLYLFFFVFLFIVFYHYSVDKHSNCYY